jgi:hypothetical protein
MSETLRIVGVDSGRELGTITLMDDGTLAFSDQDAEQMIRGRLASRGWTEAEAFDWYAHGWSNGYVKIDPIRRSRPSAGGDGDPAHG